MQEMWANKLLPNALGSCQKSNKSPNLVTLQTRYLHPYIPTHIPTHQCDQMPLLLFNL